MRGRSSTLERLADARPAVVSRTEEVVGPDERARLLRELMATEVGTPRPRRLAAPAATRAVAVAGSLAAVVAAALVVDAVRPVADPPPGSRQASGGASGAPALRTVAYVTARTKSSMAATAHSIVRARVRMTTPSGSVVTHDGWSTGDGRRNRFTSVVDGKPAYDVGSTTRDGAVDVTVVHHPARSWWTYSRPVGPEHLPDDGAEVAKPGGLTNADIRTLLDAGALTLVGEEVLGGRDTIRMSGRAKNLVDASGNVISVGPPLDLWVDANTYLPVRTAFVDDGGVRLVQDIEWLEPTDGNLEHLEVTVPSGYVRLPGPPPEPPATGGGRG